MAERITNAHRAVLYGPPCTRGNLIRAELFGQGVLVHWKVHDRLVNAMMAAHRALLAAGIPDEHPKRIDSYSCRRVSGGSSWSLHSWGLAWDCFMTPPGVEPPGGVWTPDYALPAPFVHTMEAHGFTWGGRWRRRDTPHFEWAGRP